MNVKVIDNKQNGLLGHELNNIINDDATISITTSYLTIYALEELHKKLAKSSKLRLLLDKNPFVDNNKLISPTIYFGDNSELSLKNKLNIAYLSKKCSELLENKADIKAINPGIAGSPITHIIDKQGSHTLLPSPTFYNSQSLGYLPSKQLSIFNLTSFNKDEPNPYSTYFETLWSDKNNTVDIKNDILKQLDRGYKDYTPQELYYFTLYHIFKDSLDGVDEDKVVKSKTGFKDTIVWNKLYNFQKDGVLGAIDKIEKHNGCIIADSVGLGKTFEALAVIKYYELRNHRVLVLCPKKLRENWTVYTLNDTRNTLLKDRFNYDVLNHTDLTRESGFSGEMNLETINWSNYDLVVIDESHNFRNGFARSSALKITRYSRLMDEIIKSGVRTKVLMLSATPVNSRMNDLKNQVAFITEGDELAFEDYGVNNISSVMKQAQGQFNKWLKEKKDNKDVASSKSLLESIDARYFKLLDLLTIARSRKHIEKYYDVTRIGKFPERLKPINIKSDIDLENSFPELKEINRKIRKLNLSAYSPIKYVRPEKQDEYKRRYDLKLARGSVFRQIDREQSLIQLMRVNMFKRMESSINSFTLTLKKFLKQVNAMLEKIDNHAELYQSDLNIEEIDFDDTSAESYLIGNKVKVLIQDMDIIKWKQDLREDKEKLSHLLNEAQKITSARDAKLGDLKDIIRNKIKNPINASNRKIIVFTAFADTASYLYDNLAQWALSELDINSAVVSGSKALKTNLQGVKSRYNDILTNFSPISKERVLKNSETDKEIDLLIATDCISEGQNLQDCDYLINYDIHWNPVRIIQRFGRIDRIGSKNNQIQLVNFWANMELDEYINLEARVSGRMKLLDISATGEENVIESNPEMNDLAYRRKQLEQLQNKVIDLEDIQGGISITDLTFNDFKVELLDYLRHNQDELERTPTSIHAITKLNSSEIPPGAIFCLKQITGSTDKNKAYNALEPYYLVYIDYDGNIKFTLAQSKQILDYFQKLCSGSKEIYQDLLKSFSRDTKKGKDMSCYTEMLEYAVDNILGIKREKGLASLFKTGGINLTKKDNSWIKDFEVISFLVIEN